MEKNTMTQSTQWEILSPDTAGAAKAAAFVEAWLDEMQVPLKTAHRLLIAVDEIYSNIARYSGAGKAVIRCEKDERGVTLQFIDDGKAHNPLTADEPDVTASAQEREIGGLGVFLVQKIMDEVHYCRQNDMNVLTIRKA